MKECFSDKHKTHLKSEIVIVGFKYKVEYKLERPGLLFTINCYSIRSVNRYWLFNIKVSDIVDDYLFKKEITKSGLKKKRIVSGQRKL